jgi:tyrosine-protein kinase Etk/Wzc
MAAIPLTSAPPTGADWPAVSFQALPAQLAALRRITPEVLTFHQPSHPVAEQYRALLKGIQNQIPLGGSQVFLISAAASGAGATTVLLNLAVIRAVESQRRVIVAEANLHKPALARKLGLAETPGLLDVVTGRFPLARALQETAQKNLWALVAGNTESTRAPWPHAESLRTVLSQLRKHFDWVLVDAPSWDLGPEMAAVSSACDAVYLVLRPADLDTPAVAQWMRLIPHLGAHLGGYILTQR